MSDLRRVFLSLIVVSLCLLPLKYRTQASADDSLIVALADDQRGKQKARTTSLEPAPAVANADQESARSSKPSSLIQILEARRDELLLWVAIAIMFFIIGWISGGNFYLRRDRRRSRKLRF